MSLKCELCLECLQIPLEPGDHLCHPGLLPRHRDDVVLETLVTEVKLGQGVVIDTRVHFTCYKYTQNLKLKNYQIVLKQLIKCYS